MTSFCTGQSGQHAHSARGFDLYATPAIAVTALLDANPKHLDPASVRIWEPAAGDGGIVLPLQERGFAVIASDITARDFPLHFVSDFFLLTQAPAGTTTIITHPAYRSAPRFAEHAIDLAPDVFLLLRLCFLESVRRTDLLEHRGLYTLYVVAVHEINNAIARLRERLDQEPIDDALPGEPLRAFQLIRKVVSNQFPAPAGRPRPGSGESGQTVSVYHDKK